MRRGGCADHIGFGSIGAPVANVLEDGPVKQRDVLRHQRHRGPHAILCQAGDVLAIDQDAAGLEVIGPLKQGEQRGLTDSRRPEQADTLTRRDAEIEVREHTSPVGIGKRHVLEGDFALALLERNRLGVIAQGVRDEKRRQGLGKTRQMFRHVDESDGQIARRVKHGQSERADENDVTCRRRAVLPQNDRPRQKSDN